MELGSVVPDAPEYTGLSVFDLDHTLIAANSSFRFGLYLYKKGFFSARLLGKMVYYYFRHKVLDLPQQEVHREAIRSFLGGRSRTELMTLAQEFVDAQGPNFYNARCVEELRQAKASGHYTAILSNSPAFIVAPFAQRFGVDEWHATEYALAQDRQAESTFHSLGGKEKAQLTLGIAARLGLTPKAITAYTDSYLDLPLLEIAGRAVGVHPDRRLSLLCRERQWEVLC